MSPEYTHYSYFISFIIHLFSLVISWWFVLHMAIPVHGGVVAEASRCGVGSPHIETRQRHKPRIQSSTATPSQPTPPTFLSLPQRLRAPQATGSQLSIIYNHGTQNLQEEDPSTTTMVVPFSADLHGAHAAVRDPHPPHDG